MVSLPVLVADGLFVDVLLGANWMKAISSRLDGGQMEVIVDSEKLKLKKLPGPSKDLACSGFCIYTCKMVEFFPGATLTCSVVCVPITHDKLCFLNAKSGMGLSFNVFGNSMKIELSTLQHYQ